MFLVESEFLMDNIEELEGCELGTKEYWEKSYELEIKNYENHGKFIEKQEFLWLEDHTQ